MTNRIVSKYALSKPVNNSRRQVRTAIREFEQEKAEDLAEMLEQDAQCLAECEMYFGENYFNNLTDDFDHRLDQYDGFGADDFYDEEVYAEDWEQENEQYTEADARNWRDADPGVRMLEYWRDPVLMTGAKHDDLEGVDWAARHCMGEG